MKALHLGFVLVVTSVGWAQEIHNHPRDVHGVPGGVPDFCSQPTVTSVADGLWSNPATWSTGKIPASDARVVISTGRDVVYDVVSDTKLGCVEVRGLLRFQADADTRMKTANLMVMDEGYLEVGSASAPIAASVTAEIIIADQKIDRRLDPAELGAGIESLGRIRMHGAMKSPTFVRLAEEPMTGQTTLTLEQSVTGWKAGDHIVIPDTRQLRQRERGSDYKAQDEKVEIASIAGNQITLSAPLKYDHKGARNAEDKLEFLPHIGNLSRNVIIRSENPAGTRRHMIFMSRSDIDLRFVKVRKMGRTRMGVLDNTEFTVHNSHYGLVQDNVVYNTHGAGIVTEDGTESFNIFDHNFAMRSQGSGDFAPRSGYSGAGPDPGGEGGGFWFRGPNNYIRNNVAANADVFGFQLAAGSLDSVRIPAAKGADMATDRETVPIDMTDARVLEFVNNEAYGAIQTGLAFGWNGEIKNFRAWNA